MRRLRETRHAFRVPLSKWNASLALRFALTFAPRRRQPFVRRGAAGAVTVEDVGARRVSWGLDDSHMVAHTPRGGALVKHLRGVAKAHALEFAEGEDVRCAACWHWTDAECSICNNCGGSV